MKQLIAENATNIKGSSILQGGRLLIEVNFYDCSVTIRASIPSSGNPVSTLREEDKATAHIAIKSPFGSTYGVQHKCPATFRASTDSLGNHRMSACRVRTEEAWHSSSFPQLPRSTAFNGTKERINTFKWRIIVAVWAEWE